MSGICGWINGPGDDAYAQAVLDTIERRRVTHVYLPPTAIYMLLEEPGLQDRDFGSLRNFIYTSSPMSAARWKVIFSRTASSERGKRS